MSVDRLADGLRALEELLRGEYPSVAKLISQAVEQFDHTAEEIFDLRSVIVKLREENERLVKELDERDVDELIRSTPPLYELVSGAEVREYIKQRYFENDRVRGTALLSKWSRMSIDQARKLWDVMPARWFYEEPSSQQLEIDEGNLAEYASSHGRVQED